MAWLRKFSYREVGADAEFLQTKFEQLGLKWKSTSALGRMVAAAHQLASFEECGEPIGRLDQQSVAMLDGLRMVEHLAKGIRAVGEDPGLRMRLNRLVKGDLHPAGTQHSEARNIAFELYVAAAVRKSGWEPRLAEPDLICKNASAAISTVTIACKQSESPRNIDHQARKAIEQIETARSDDGTAFCGIVALDLSVLCDHSGFGRKAFHNGQEVMAGLCRQMAAFVDQQTRIPRAIRASKSIPGLLLFATVLGFSDVGGKAMPVLFSPVVIHAMAYRGSAYDQTLRSFAAVSR